MSDMTQETQDARPPGPLAEQSAALEAAQSAMGKALAVLAKEMDPFLLPPPESINTENAEPKVDPHRSYHAAWLADRVADERSKVEHLNRLIARIDRLGR